MVRSIDNCRICGNKYLAPLLDLGEQFLTGVFPKTLGERITKGPLALVKCDDEHNPSACGLVQLKHSYAREEMYGENYGYRSGLNRSMVTHLNARVAKILELVTVKAGDLVIDIGSNDSTLLQGYPRKDLRLVGIDPAGVKFQSYYPKHIDLIPDFFSADKVKAKYRSQKAKVISSIAMFYDLESPVDFMRQVYELLDEGGVWVFEQSYMPAMLEQNAYDTICHEHLEYYGLKQIKYMTDFVGFKIVDLEFSDVNGGSFTVTVAKRGNEALAEKTALVERTLAQESHSGLTTLRPFTVFKQRIEDHRRELVAFIRDARTKVKRLLGYGASTKGNVILQYCGLTRHDIAAIAEVNEDKFGRLTPGTNIPIISEAEARAMRPDYLLVLPWHFRENIIEREQDYLVTGGALVFPLPKIEIVDRHAELRTTA
jgi:C-methyltransferase-like protein/putative zinc binding protein/methyltransferase family protein